MSHLCVCVAERGKEGMKERHTETERDRESVLGRGLSGSLYCHKSWDVVLESNLLMSAFLLCKQYA